jgi:GNAT superfamily N-acetyltransferase
MRLRNWEGPADKLAMQHLARRMWPRGRHPGGLGWEVAISQLPESLVLAEQDDRLVGWAGIRQGELALHADASYPEAARELADWAAKSHGPDGPQELSVPVNDGASAVIEAVLAAGFVPKPDTGPWRSMFLDCAARRPVVLPDGWQVRPVRDDELAERVEVHRAAWRPFTRPWPGAVPDWVTPEGTSRFTAADYDRVRETWLYDQSLDLVVEAPDGSLAGCCIVWLDPELGVAEIEPLGVVPEHRRKGLAGALCLTAAALVAERAGAQMFIDTGPDPDYPAPGAAYAAAGFTAVARETWYHRPSS